MYINKIQTLFKSPPRRGIVAPLLAVVMVVLVGFHGQRTLICLKSKGFREKSYGKIGVLGGHQVSFPLKNQGNLRALAVGWGVPHSDTSSRSTGNCDQVLRNENRMGHREQRGTQRNPERVGNCPEFLGVAIFLSFSLFSLAHSVLDS
jgi:hypothetical protein